MLRDIPNKREVWAWGMYDLANQSFQLLINTLLFSIFFVQVIVGNDVRGERLWSFMTAASLLLVVILSPILGALADQRAWKRELLLGTGLVCAALTAALALLQPNNITLAFALYVTAAVACGLGENFLASFLPQISTPKNVGLVSATGWAMSYAGALILLGITAAYAFLANRPEPAQARPLFIFAGLWFLAGMIPAMLFLPERAIRQPGPSGLLIVHALRRLAASARETRRFRQLARFLAIFFVYSMGTYIVVYFLGLIGTSLGFKLPQLILFALLISSTAGIGAIATARYQDRMGHRRTISTFLIIWTIATFALAWVKSFGAPPWIIWTVSGAIGLALGGIGTASRAMVGLFTPTSRAAEFFGLWGMTAKLSAIVGILTYGQLRSLFKDVPVDVGLLATAGFFLAGFLLMRLVDEKEGAATAATASAEPSSP